MKKILNTEPGLSEDEQFIISTFRSFEVALQELYTQEPLYINIDPTTLEPVIYENGIIWIDLQGKLFLKKQEVIGIEKIIGLIAIAKQKQSPNTTMEDEVFLNIFHGVHKNRETVANINKRLKEHKYQTLPAEYPAFNKILPLIYAFDEWHRVQKDPYHNKEMSGILIGFIVLYAHLNHMPPWLFHDEDNRDIKTWDSWLHMHLQQSDGFNTGCMDRLLAELNDNNISNKIRALIDTIQERAIGIQQM